MDAEAHAFTVYQKSRVYTSSYGHSTVDCPKMPYGCRARGANKEDAIPTALASRCAYAHRIHALLYCTNKLHT